MKSYSYFYLHGGKAVVLQKIGDRFQCFVVSGSGDVKMLLLKPENFVHLGVAGVNETTETNFIDCTPSNLGGGRLTVSQTIGGAFRFQVLDLVGKAVLHNLVVPSAQSAITFQANTIQITGTEDLPCAGASEVFAWTFVCRFVSIPLLPLLPFRINLPPGIIYGST